MISTQLFISVGENMSLCWCQWGKNAPSLVAVERKNVLLLVSVRGMVSTVGVSGKNGASLLVSVGGM
ncbi:unnamed protein product, partial [Staurois parvus]